MLPGAGNAGTRAAARAGTRPRHLRQLQQHRQAERPGDRILVAHPGPHARIAPAAQMAPPRPCGSGRTPARRFRRLWHRARAAGDARQFAAGAIAGRVCRRGYRPRPLPLLRRLHLVRGAVDGGAGGHAAGTAPLLAPDPGPACRHGDGGRTGPPEPRGLRGSGRRPGRRSRPPVGFATPPAPGHAPRAGRRGRSCGGGGGLLPDGLERLVRKDKGGGLKSGLPLYRSPLPPRVGKRVDGDRVAKKMTRPNGLRSLRVSTYHRLPTSPSAKG
ncbi:protein of unknown function [Magnetospirillum sp. XM-1]|nr:protein of unknown function [Magnetospirillum sp. XM-1]